MSRSHDSAPEAGRPGRADWLYVAGLLAGFALVWANWRAPVLRFAWQPLNVGTFLLALLAPAAAAALAACLRPSWAAWPLAVLLLLPALGALLLAVPTGILLADTLTQGADPSFTPVRTVPAGPYSLRVYRTNGGATTSFGAVVRQERTILPGLRLVREVYRSYPAEDVHVERLAPGIYAFDGRPPGAPLSPAVWW